MRRTMRGGGDQSPQPLDSAFRRRLCPGRTDARTLVVPVACSNVCPAMDTDRRHVVPFQQLYRINNALGFCFVETSLEPFPHVYKCTKLLSSLVCVRLSACNEGQCSDVFKHISPPFKSFTCDYSGDVFFCMIEILMSSSM